MQSLLAGMTPGQFFGKAYGRLTRPTTRIAISYNNLEARLFDLRHGTDTAGKTPFQELDVAGDAVPHGTGYQAVNEAHFNAVIRDLPIPSRSGFIDIGCGKGKPLLLASRHPHFSSVRGVELSKNLCDIAKENVAIFAERFPTKASVHVINGDAAGVDIPAETNVIYVNNPFDAVLMARMMGNIERSLDAAPRKIWLLYFNPASASSVEASGRFRFVKDYRFYGPGRNVRVYTSR